MKQAFSKQITGNVNRIVKLHEVCVEKIVDNTEQPLKAIQSMQIGQSFYTRHSVGKSIEIVCMNSIVCVDKIVDNREQLLKAR